MGDNVLVGDDGLRGRLNQDEATLNIMGAGQDVQDTVLRGFLKKFEEKTEGGNRADRFPPSVVSYFDVSCSG
jgi:hypothetical protein